MKNLFYFLTAGILITGCAKEPGRGGTGSISGRVYVYDVNGVGDTLQEFYGMDEDVYIIYGDKDSTYDDKFACSFDGSFRFDYLTPGDYTLFAYSRCLTCPDETEVVKKTVTIKNKKDVINIGKLNILK